MLSYNNEPKRVINFKLILFNGTACKSRIPRRITILEGAGIKKEQYK